MQTVNMQNAKNSVIQNDRKGKIIDKARIATPSIEKKKTHPFPACPTLLSVAFACPALGPGSVSVNAYAKALVEAIGNGVSFCGTKNTSDQETTVLHRSSLLEPDV